MARITKGHFFGITAVICAIVLGPKLLRAEEISATAQSQGLGQASVNQYSEGARIAPAVGAPQGNSTADCVVAGGFSLTTLVEGLPFGASLNIPKINDECVTRIEARFLVEIAGMKNPKQRNVAIYHFCANDKSMRQTMVALGMCTIATRK